jgi:hypothetical protein
VSVPANKEILITMEEDNWAFGTIQGQPRVEWDSAEF